MVVRDDDEGSTTPVKIDISDAEAWEANTHVVFTVILDTPPSGTVTVDYATRDGTARAGSD